MKKKAPKTKLWKLVGITYFPGGYERTFEEVEIPASSIRRKKKKPIR